MTLSVKELIEEVAELEAKVRTARAELSDKIKPRFHELFKPFLDKYPDIKRISFTAYTPYFNDGESCEYSVNQLTAYRGTEDECEYEGILNRYGPSYPSLLHFKRTGEVNKNLAIHVASYIKPSSRWDYAAKKQVEVPPKFKSLSDAVRVTYREILVNDEDYLVKMGEIEDDWRELKAVFRSIPENVIYQMFDDHIRVNISREGVEVEEYEHD